MTFAQIITFLCSLLFLMIGVDKFFHFMDPPCSLMDEIPGFIWQSLGVLQLVSAVIIWLPKYRKHLAGFWAVFMMVFTAIHLVVGTNDFGGALFMAVLLGILAWNPGFIQGSRQ